MNNLQALRNSLIYIAIFFILSFLLSFYFSGNIFSFLIQPFQNLYPHISMIYTSPQEIVYLYFRIAIYSAILSSIPFASLVIYKFSYSGLSPKERLVSLILLIFSLFLFTLAAYTSYSYSMPYILRALNSLSSNYNYSSEIIVIVPKAIEFLEFAKVILIIFTVTFQMPILLTFLTYNDIISINILKKGRKYVIVLSFIVAAIITPPDALSQIILAVILYCIYEISIVFANIFKKVLH